jgi:hypothetical protein
MKKVFGYLIYALFVGWCVLPGFWDRPAKALSRYIPGWLAPVIVASQLILILISESPLDLPENFRLSMEILVTISWPLLLLLLPVAPHSYIAVNVLIAGLLLFEIVWLFPRWKARRQQKSPSAA